jgi:hypothetical protein
LSVVQREHFFEHGYVVLPRFLSEEWLAGLKVSDIRAGLTFN